jgi:uncharacterized membrane protein YfhO
MVLGYYGTTAYSSFNNVNYTEFLIAVGAISNDISSSTHWSAGLLARPLVSTFVCEKYVLTGDPVPYQTANAYEFMKSYGDIYVFRNRFSLPLGLTFTSFYPESSFWQLPENLRTGVLLHAVVLPDKIAAESNGLRLFALGEMRQELSDIMNERRESGFKMHSFSQTRIDGGVHLDAKGVLVLQTPFDPGWHARQDDRVAPVLKVDVGLLGVALDSGDHEVQLRYTPPFLARGAIVSLISLLVLIASHWRWPRMRLPA